MTQNEKSAKVALFSFGGAYGILNQASIAFGSLGANLLRKFAAGAHCAHTIS